MPALRQAMYAQGVQIHCAPITDDRSVLGQLHGAHCSWLGVFMRCQPARQLSCTHNSTAMHSA